MDSKCSTCLKGGRHDDLVASMNLEGALTLFESWHGLELLPSKWTTKHRYKCNLLKLVNAYFAVLTNSFIIVPLVEGGSLALNLSANLLATSLFVELDEMVK